MPIRLFVVDDHALYRSGVKAYMARHPDVEIVGEAATAEEAVDRIPTEDPDVVLMDLRLPGMDGLNAVGLLVALGIRGGILVVTAADEEESRGPSLEAGALGFLPKTASAQDLLEAIRAVARGEAPVVAAGDRPPLPPEAEALHDLTPRNREILALTAAGYTSKEIARRLHTTPGAVDTARARTMGRLGLAHRSEVVRFALRADLLKDL